MTFDSADLGISLSGMLYLGKPVFDAVELARKLGYANPADALKKHCKQLIKLNYSETRELGLGENLRGMQLAPESDAYRLILKSQLPKAERVQDWVCEDVLPSIRETGSYGAPTIDPMASLNDPEFLRGTLLTYTEKVIGLEHKVKEVSNERDKAVRTKSQISRKREASALGKLSAATRKCRELEERLGESVKHATITKVEGMTGGEYKFVDLRRWCKANGVTAVDVPDPRYGSVKSWPAGAWLDVYGINLKTLFGEKK
nr:BRO family protein [Serratia marcescens]